MWLPYRGNAVLKQDCNTCSDVGAVHFNRHPDDEEMLSDVKQGKLQMVELVSKTAMAIPIVPDRKQPCLPYSCISFIRF